MHESQRWNLSPERLYLDCWTRAFLRDRIDPSTLERVCNVGVGAGEHDDWLGYWLDGHASLVSVDINADQVRALADRQARQEHPNPAEVVHADLLQADLGPFDLVTATGSTLHETHAPVRAIQCARAWVRPGGHLMITILHDLGDPDRILATLDGVVARETHDELPSATLTAVLFAC